MNRYLIVVNPVSGSGRGKKSIDEIDSYFRQSKLAYKIIPTEYHRHAVSIVKDNFNDFDIIISAGGDGTVNEIINGFQFPTEKIFGVLPIGSGNDFSSNLNLSKNLKENLELITNPSKKIIKSDVLTVKFKENNIWKEKLSVNAVGIGFDAYIAHKNQNNKKIGGILSYILAVLGALNDIKAINFNINVDDREVKGNFILITIGNGKSSGGGFYLTPKAIIDDGLLNITTVENVRKLKLIKELPKALLNKMEQIKEASFYTGKKISIELDTPYFVHSDGEIIGTSITELAIEILDYKLNTISA